MRHLACIPHVLRMCVSYGVAWSSEGSRVALSTRSFNNHLSGKLIAFDLVRGLRAVISIDLEFTEWNDVTWQGDELVACEVHGSYFKFPKPFSLSQGQVERLPFLADHHGWFSANGSLVLDRRPRRGAQVLRLSDGRLVCNVRTTCLQSDISICSWSPDSAFLAVSGNTCFTFYDAVTGAVVLQGLGRPDVCTFNWAPDCCSIAVAKRSTLGHCQHVHLVRLAP